MFSPTSPKAGEVVTVTKDAAASGGIYENITTVALAQGTVGDPAYVRIVVYFNTNANDNNSGSFVMPVLPASGTWDVKVVGSGDLQGFGTLTYGGAGDWVCAQGWDQVVADSKTLCEKRLATSDSLTVPADVTSMQFLVVGGGGGGGGGVNDTTYDFYGAGSGGGGGEVRVCTETVTPAETWTATVGGGGSAGGGPGMTAPLRRGPATAESRPSCEQTRQQTARRQAVRVAARLTVRCRPDLRGWSMHPAWSQAARFNLHLPERVGHRALLMPVETVLRTLIPA